jgi:hypothetical protein
MMAFLFARNRCSPGVRYSTAELGFAALISIAARQLLRMTGDGVRRVVAHFMSRPEARRRRYRRLVFIEFVGYR